MLTLLNLILSAINIYFYILIVSVFMSWVPSIKESSFGQMISKITDPYLDIFRRFIPPIGMIDISPIVAIFTLNLASQGIIVLFRFFA
ncbi:YggT family protein [Planococcus sp. PAMC 21323]|uniref:YggT family protein n=1 Tax=Planococcus sp. PAMC 21323 TaxID=1526927 RepID=UPI00056FED8F|nr:YggT family protein [Planococcus sp. PAMC 21323]